MAETTPAVVPAKPLRLWRCHNPKCQDTPPKSGHDFTSDVPQCDKCGINQATPRVGFVIVPLVAIHFDPPHAMLRGIGQGVLACTGKPRAKEQMTASWRAVSCPFCKQSPEFLAAQSDDEVLPEFQLPLAADLKKGTVALVHDLQGQMPATKTGGCG